MRTYNINFYFPRVANRRCYGLEFLSFPDTKAKHTDYIFGSYVPQSPSVIRQYHALPNECFYRKWAQRVFRQLTDMADFLYSKKQT